MRVRVGMRMCVIEVLVGESEGVHDVSDDL